MAVVITNFSGGIDAVEPSATLIKASNYLYSLCGRYGLLAQRLINPSGGTVAPITPGSAGIYPFIIISSDFEADGKTYLNSAMAGDTLSLFVNEYSQQWLVVGINTFSLVSGGFIMNIPGFDANSQEWTIMVQKITSQ